MKSKKRPAQVYIIYTIIQAIKLLTGKYIERSINNRFPLLNDAGLLFAILYSYKEVQKIIEYRVFLITKTIEGTK